MRFITAQEALAVHRALVFTVKTPVNKPGHMPPVLPTCSACKCRMALRLSGLRNNAFVGPVSKAPPGIVVKR
ncbi:hypothetical protein C3Z09_15650 [Lelliottia aquatilis]|nr:hypothetical protein C3Z09_15650 [Lelliottia aquatilis]